MDDECNGICLTAADIGVPYDGIAYAHPDCPAHGEGDDPDADVCGDGDESLRFVREEDVESLTPGS